jgi:hypothetical protein
VHFGAGSIYPFDDREERIMDLSSEKRRADVLRYTAPYPESEYWAGYRIGLTAESEHHEAFLASIGSPDAGRDARGRGYRDGCAVRKGRSGEGGGPSRLSQEE